MSLLVNHILWDSLDLSDPGRNDLASRCFFLGRGVEETRRLLDGFDPAEVKDVLEISEFSGYKSTLHGLVLNADH